MSSHNYITIKDKYYPGHFEFCTICDISKLHVVENRLYLLIADVPFEKHFFDRKEDYYYVYVINKNTYYNDGKVFYNEPNCNDLLIQNLIE